MERRAGPQTDGCAVSVSDHTTEETGWHTVAAHMVTAEPRRSLWSPQDAPMRVRDYVGLTVLTVAAVVAFTLWWGATP